MTRNGNPANWNKERPLRVAYFSPLPPSKTGIADYSLELLPSLAERAQVTLFITKSTVMPAQLIGRINILPVRAYAERRWHYDVSFYQMGNSGQNHEIIYRMALRYPGIVVIHDQILHHFIAYATIGQNDHASYAREIGYALGTKGYDLAWDIRRGLVDKPEYELALNNRLIDRSLGLIVHSEYAAQEIRNYRADRPVQVVPQHRPIINGKSRRSQLGLKPKTIIFASTGLVNSTKQMDKALASFAKLRQENPDVFYLIVGGVHNDVNLKRLIRKNRLQKAVKHTGFVSSLQEFSDWTATADVIVNLRNPTLGETSATALRAMAAGKPLIVYDHGWYSEIPDEACLKVAPGDSEGLLHAMQTLAEDDNKRVGMGLAARTHIATHHQPKQAADSYINFAHDVLAGLGRRIETSQS